MWTVESTEIERALTLHPFYRYALIIAAVTIDTGPYSVQLYIQMPEDGKQSNTNFHCKKEQGCSNGSVKK